MKNTNSKGFVPIIIIAFVAAIALAMVGVGIYFKMQNDKQAKENANANQSVANTNQVTVNTNATTNTNNTNQNANTNMATDDTTGWQMYSNEKYGYSIKYPKDWVFDAKDITKVDLLSPASQGELEQFKRGEVIETTVDLIINHYAQLSELSGYTANYKTLKDYAYRNEGKKTDNGEPIKVSTLTINNNEAYKVDEFNGYLNTPNFSIYFTNGKDIMEIVSIYGTDLDYKIAKTFQFTNETAGWKTYTNSEYGFSFQYPKSWAVENKILTGGSFEAKNVLDQFVISPPESPLDFQPAGECSLSVFNSANETNISDWISDQNIYVETGSEGLNIQNQEEKRINNLQGLLIGEGGPNYTKSISFYYKKNNYIFRYGFYEEVDVRPQATFQEYSTICKTILGTLN